MRKAIYVFRQSDWRSISNDAKDLIRLLLQVDPAQRCSAQKALGHRWIRTTAPQASTKTALKASPALLDNLRNFRSQNKLKKAALQIIATQLDDAQLRNLRDIFTALDTNGDGLLTTEELQSGLERAGLGKAAEDLHAICDGVDTDGSGVIDYTEFLAAALDKRSYLSEQACRTAFKVFDLDGDGKISVEELRALLEDDGHADLLGTREGREGGTERAARLLMEVDCNGDGMIDYQEFMKMMGGCQGSHSLPSPVASRRGGA